MRNVVIYHEMNGDYGNKTWQEQAVNSSSSERRSPQEVLHLYYK